MKPSRTGGIIGGLICFLLAVAPWFAVFTLIGNISRTGLWTLESTPVLVAAVLAFGGLAVFFGHSMAIASFRRVVFALVLFPVLELIFIVYVFFIARVA